MVGNMLEEEKWGPRFGFNTDSFILLTGSTNDSYEEIRYDEDGQVFLADV